MNKKLFIDFFAPYMLFYLAIFLCFGFSMDFGVPVLVAILSFFVALGYFASLHLSNGAYSLTMIAFIPAVSLCFAFLFEMVKDSAVLGYILFPEAIVVFGVLIFGRLIRLIRSRHK